MTPKHYAFVGWASGILFWVTYLVMSTIRPDYYHNTKAVSELGSLDASNAFAWNAIGFVTVGVLISFFSVGVHRSVSRSGRNRIAFGLLFAVGLFWALAGIFPGDFENKKALTMILHAVGAIGSGLFFVLAVFAYSPAMKASSYWRSMTIPSVAIAVGFISSGFLRTGSAPALGQKFGFLLFFIWVSLMASKLYRSEQVSTYNSGQSLRD